MSKYHALHSAIVEGNMTFRRPPQILPENVTADSPAIDVMTDFTKISAVTMGPCATLDAAEKRMIATGVRMLLVIDQSNHILGVITLTDLQGERPVLYLQDRGGSRDEIFLRDIMTSSSNLEVLQMREVMVSTVGDIIETMRIAHRQHALVVETDEEGQIPSVRGIFSTKQISIQLGLDYRAKDTAAIFSELSAFL